uniref:Uncharacterized protein n=1 Tax=Glossina morsitans morsitans TaxID=37546 RepID=A0A1B0FQH2_GLOMM
MLRLRSQTQQLLHMQSTFGLLQIIQQIKLNSLCIYQEHCQQMLQIDLNQNKTKINNPHVERDAILRTSIQYQLIQYPSIENLDIIE